MKRIHLFEFEDQSWFPDVIRKGITDYLQYAANRIDLYKSLLPVIRRGLSNDGTNNIVDLCSGGGGGIYSIYTHLKDENPDLQITLTDKFPNVPAFKVLSDKTGGKIGYRSESVDVMKVPADIKGMRTMLVSFHHFKPDHARSILKNAADNNAVIGIFEATERSIINFIGMLFTPLVVMLAVPFIRPVKFSRLFFTYIIPAIPLFTMWDGIVSVLRTYSVKEMKQLTAEVNAPDYIWEIGAINIRRGPRVLFLLGYPKKPKS